MSPRTLQGSTNTVFVSAPAALSKQRRTGRPKVHGSNRITTISHEEYMVDLSTTTENFHANALRINPGNETMFPWLAGVSRNFQTYRFKKLQFAFSGTAAVGDPGHAMMAVVPDPYLSLPENKREFLALENATVGEFWTSFSTSLAKRNYPEDHLFIRPGAEPLSHEDLKTIDYGQLYFGTSNGDVSNPGAKGDLLVSYIVEFFTPVADFTLNPKYIRRGDYVHFGLHNPYEFNVLGRYVIPFDNYIIDINGATYNSGTLKIGRASCRERV